MRKFIIRLSIIGGIGTAILFLYATIFFYFEPINYFGLKSKTELTYDPVWKMKDFLANPSQYIILGNSQVAHIDVDTLKKYSGKRFSNIAFGGASLKESVDQFWWATEHIELKEVWIAASFYTLNANYNWDRTEKLKTMTSNPLRYMTDKYYIDLAFQQLLGKTSQNITPTTTVDTTLRYRQDLVEYSKVIEGAVEDYRFNDKIIERLAEIGEYCKKHNIRLVFVVPPMHESIFELVVEPQGLEPYVAKTIEQLSAIGTVYDFEFTNDFMKNQDNFGDGFHLVEGNPTGKYIRTLGLGQTCDIMRLR